MFGLDTESDLYLLVGGQYKEMMCAPRIALSMPSKRTMRAPRMAPPVLGWRILTSEGMSSGGREQAMTK
jgi:hypothetical protein